MARTATIPARERILEAASRLFYAHGVRAVGVDKVIDEAGVAKATLYAHFRTKSDLVDAYLETRVATVHADLDRIDQTTPSGPARIAAVFDHVAATAAGPDYHGCCFINASAEHLEPGGRASQLVEEHRTTLIDYFTQNLSHLDPDHRSETAQILVALLDGAKVASTAETDRSPLPTLRQAAEAIARGLPWHQNSQLA